MAEATATAPPMRMPPMRSPLASEHAPNTRRPWQELPAEVFDDFQRKALGLVTVYFALLFGSLLFIANYIERRYPGYPYDTDVMPRWLQCLVGLLLWGFIKAMAKCSVVTSTSRFDNKKPLGQKALLTHAVITGLNWGATCPSMNGELLMKLVFILFASWAVVFGRVALTGGHGPDGPTKSNLERTWLNGWLAACLAVLLFSLAIGNTPFQAIIVGLEALWITMSVGGWKSLGALRLLCCECKFDDYEIVTVTMVEAFLPALHVHMGVYYMLWSMS